MDNSGQGMPCPYIMIATHAITNVTINTITPNRVQVTGHALSLHYARLQQLLQQLMESNRKADRHALSLHDRDPCTAIAIINAIPMIRGQDIPC